MTRAPQGVGGLAEELKMPHSLVRRHKHINVIPSLSHPLVPKSTNDEKMKGKEPHTPQEPLVLYLSAVLLVVN